jgi:2-iminobutanoate/2-iminopropanoate deaminase
MPIIKHNPSTVFPQYKNYSHAIETTSGSRHLFISGLNGYEPNGQSMPESFWQQGLLIWQHLGEILKSAGMTYSNLVSVRTYLASPEYDRENVELRKNFLGSHEPALTVICCQLLETKWKLEVEAVAAD